MDRLAIARALGQTADLLALTLDVDAFARAASPTGARRARRELQPARR
jgi:hypothetical protein